MGCETIDTNAVDLRLVVPGDSVSISQLKESLISAGVLKEAGVHVVNHIPADAVLDGIIQ
jgi:hypothetical protein